MQEKKRPVFVFATANNIASLPPELLRKGRFDEIFFVDLPNEKERSEIFRIHLRRIKRNPDQFDIDKLVNLSGEAEWGDGVRLTGSEIEVIRQSVPLSKTRKEEIGKMREWAAENAVKASVAIEAPNVQTARREVTVGRNIEF